MTSPPLRLYPPPVIRAAAVGTPTTLGEVCELAGLQKRVSEGVNGPRLRISRGTGHIKAVDEVRPLETDDLSRMNRLRKATTPVNMAILKEIHREPGLILSDYAERLAMPLSNVSRGCRLLERAELIEISRQGRRAMAFCSPLGRLLARRSVLLPACRR